MTRHILFFIFRLLARFRLPRTAAYLLLLTSRTLPIFPSSAQSNHRRRALIMTRVGFSQDIEQSFGGTDAFELIAWPSYTLKAFSAAILSPSLDHNNYLTKDAAAEASKAEYRQFLAELWKVFRRLKPTDVVLTGNFAYFTEREFAAALENVGTPFIALHKENVRPPKRVKEYWHNVYKNRRGEFSGRKILVYNNVERDLEISSGIAEANRIVVTGMPRLDKIHRWRHNHAGSVNGEVRPLVLFFAFSRQDKLTAIQRKPTAGLPGNMEDMDGEWGKLSWTRLGDSTHQTIVDLARSRPDIQVIVKSKGQRRKQNDILEMLKDASDLPPNLSVVTGGDPFGLITSSRVVVGFNTTGLLEAVAAGKPVIVPWFGEAADDRMREHIIDLGKAVEYAHSPAELAAMICRYTDNPTKVPLELAPDAAKTLRYWVGNDDGKAGVRVLEAIRQEVR